MSIKSTLTIAGLISLALPQTVMACAVCITGADDSSANAFNWSMLFLLGTPYLVAGSIAGWLYYCYRRAAAKRDATAEGEPIVHLAMDQKESGR